MKMMSEIEALEELIRTGKMPPALELDPIEMQKAVQNLPAGLQASIPQKQDPVEITAAPIGQRVPLPNLNKEDDGLNYPNSPVAEGYRRSVNPALQATVDKSLDDRQYADQMLKKWGINRDKQQADIDALDNIPKPAPSPFSAKLSETKEAYEKEKYPQQNVMANMVADAVPVILGALGGTAAKRAALPGFKVVQDVKNSARKEELEIHKSQKDNLKQNYSAVLEADKAFRDDELKRMDLEMKRIGLKLQRGEGLSNQELQLVTKSQATADKSEGHAYDAVRDSAKTMAQLEKDSEQFRQKMEAKKAAAGKKGIKGTDGQYQAALYANSMMQSQAALEKMKQDRGMGVLPSAQSKFFQTLTDIDTGKFGNATVSSFIKEVARDNHSFAELKDIEDQITHEKNFIAGVMRKESGAAVTIPEWLDMRRRYFDIYGATPDQSKINSANRNSAMRQMKISAGPVPIDFEENPKERIVNIPKYKTAVPEAPKPPKKGDVDGGYRFKGGDPSKKENWEKVK